MVDFTGVQTMDDILTQIMGSVFGGGAIGGLMGGLLKQPMYSMLGLQNGNQRDALLDFVLSSDKTPFGTAMELQNRRFTRIASANMQRLSNNAMRNWLADVGRTTMSYNSWLKQPGQQEAGADRSEAAYNAFIQNQAAGWSNNFLWKGLYQFADPDGMMAAQQYLQEAGTNVIRRGYLNGRRGAVLQARAVGNLFTNAKGEFSYNPADYGFMNVGEASAVAAALTKDLDFFSGSGVNSEKIKEASKRLDKMLKDYTQALAPLKDVFGKDVPAMIKAVEELSGKRLTQMDAAQVNRTVRQALDGAVAGNYTLEQQVQAGAAWRGALLQMNVPFLNDLSTMSVTGSILSATNVAGVAPRTMSAERWTKMASDRITRASVSAGGAAFAQAYAIMKSRDQSLTYDKFMSAYNSAFNGSIDQTLYRLTGTRNAAELARRGAESGYLADAYEEGVNKLAALEQGAGRSRARLRDMLLAQGYRSTDIDEAISYFNSTDRMHGTRVEADAGLSSGAGAIANALLVSPEYQDAMTGMRVLYSEKEAQARQAIVSRNRIISEKVRSMAPGSIGEAVRQFIAGDLTWDKMKKRNKEMFLIANSDAWDLGKKAYSIGKALFNYTGSKYGDVEALGVEAADYAIRTGATDENYLEWMEKFDKAKTRKEKDQAAEVLMAMQYGDSAEIGEYLRNGGDPKLIAKKMREAIRSGATSTFAIEVSDAIKGDKLLKSLSGNKKIEDKLQVITEGINAYTAEEGAVDIAGLKGVLTKAGVSSEMASELISNAGLQTNASLESILTDKFNILDDLAKALRDLVNKLSTKDGLSPEKEE